MKYIWIRTASIKSFFSLGRFFSLQIRTILFMFVFRFEFGYCPLSSNFWMVSNSVRQDLASLDIVWIFLKPQTWALLDCVSLCPPSGRGASILQTLWRHSVGCSCGSAGVWRRSPVCSRDWGAPRRTTLHSGQRYGCYHWTLRCIFDQTHGII